MEEPVVVGVDGSPSSMDAVSVAAGEARLRGCGLKVVHAFIWPVMHVPLGPSPLGPAEGGLRNIAERLVADAVDRARSVAPEVPVTGALVTGEALTVLEHRSQTACLVVVGSRGLGGFLGLLLGSTAVHLAAHGRCPVMVVRGRGSGAGPVLLGLDRSDAGRGAVGFAFEEAALRGTRLVALEAGERRPAAASLAGRQERYPDVPVEHTVVQGGAREELIAASAEAGLVVVGARGRGGFTGLLLGSVSQAVLHHARCPVVVVRGPGVRR
ncbi:universal stress protein [Streptomyces sp. TR06-5]|uniref:universal stress protein n=1 Tax=unclassified Streptomyces TaxID=2593676 RepID=UPI00399FA2F4